MKQSFELKQQQKLKITPQLQQAIRLLQLSSQELSMEVQAMLEANPLLELDNTDDLQEMSLQSPCLDDDIPDHETSNQDSSDHHSATLEYETQKPEEPSLQECLLWQINLSGFSSKERLIANAIIDAISEDGYLSCHLEEIQDTLQAQESGEFAMADIETVLFKIQQFEPLGVGARNLSECLGIQLNSLPPKTPWLLQAKHLVNSELPLLGIKDYPGLCSALQITKNDLKGVIRLITKLDPRPGRQIHTHVKSTECIIPDLILKKKKEGFVVELNMEVVPKIRLNMDYALALKSVSTDREGGTFYKQHLKEAQWFIQGLKKRYSTLLKVANCIIKKQSDFLERGEEFMQGLSLQDIASLTDLHESTISRVTTNKYLHTHRGSFELKHFFSTEVKTEDGALHAATAIKAMIKKIIENESSVNPLSDEAIREILLKKNIALSRRTITKYREAMRIQPSKQRHRLNKVFLH